MKTALIKAALALTVLLTGTAQAALSRNDVKRLIVAEAEATQVPIPLALAVAKVESDFQGSVRSTKGARGVMQIMPATARDEFGVAADELWDERLNVQLGLYYLAQLHDQYGGRWDLALSHYNGGTLRGQGENARPHSYTRGYVEKVLRWRRRYADQAAVWLATDAKPAQDGWTPARTSVSMTTADERHAPDDTYPQRRLRRRADTDRIKLAHDADLDDFASGRIERIVRLHRSTGNLSAVVRWRDN
jgi:hypothetical protein